jgi:hypothetical protein
MSRKIYGVGLAALLAVATYGTAKSIKRDEPIRQEYRDTLQAPLYSIPANHCSRYVRKADKELFNIDVPADDAWNIRNHRGVKTIPLENPDNLYELVDQQTVVPGDIIGTYNPRSAYNRNPNAMKAGYTHVMLYLGEKDGHLYFAHQFGDHISRINLRDVKDKHLMPVEVLHIEKKN